MNSETPFKKRNEQFVKSNEKTVYVVERMRVRMEEMSKFPQLE